MKKGFTLVELLAVIVILAVILAIAIPAITGLINNVTINAFETDAKMVLKAINYKMLTDGNYDIEQINRDTMLSDFNISNNNYDNLYVVSDENEKLYIFIEGKGKWEGLVACGSFNYIHIGDGTECFYILPETSVYDEEKGVNKPQLANGMTPIKWDGSTWINTTEDDNEWYDYDVKKWANAMTEDGSFWVWIPRFSYQIATNYDSHSTGTINVKFLKNRTYEASDEQIVDLIPTYTGSSQTNYILHPSFTFGNLEIFGFWAAKFQATTLTANLKITPNSLVSIDKNLNEIFNLCRNMETNEVYGWGTSGKGIDTHLTKNIEWGALAYLSKSSYGKEIEEIWINPYHNFHNPRTGCAGNSVASNPTTGGACTNSYETANGVKASTTANHLKAFVRF